MSSAIIIVLLLVTTSWRSEARHPKIPDVTITVYRPRGIKISILCGFDIHSFNFEAQINDEKIICDEPNANVPPNQTKEWVLKNENAQVEVGDKLHYSMFIFNEIDGFVIDKTIEIDETNIFRNPEQRKICSNDECYSTNCEIFEKVINLTKTAEEWRQKVETLNVTVGVLKNILDRIPKATKYLKLSGMIPPGDPLSVAQDVVRQKLRLTTKLREAVRKASGSIKFSVDSLDDKIEILVAAATKLQHSRMRIY